MTVLSARASAPRNAPVLERAAAEDVTPRWDEPARRVLGSPGGFLRVLGAPGTGKTTLAAELVADRVLRRDVEAGHILVLTASRRSAAALRGRITRLLAGATPPDGLRIAREPLVRTVHSYAFGVLRLQAALHGDPPPRLMAAPEQDATIRELLKDDRATPWPARLRPALELPGFAAELRDLLLRAAERGLGPEDLIWFGQRYEREEWVAAGEFGRQYEQVTLLRGAVGGTAEGGGGASLDAAELVASALLAFEVDEDLRTREQARVRYLVVDDAQHLDPQQFDNVIREQVIVLAVGVLRPSVEAPVCRC